MERAYFKNIETLPEGSALELSEVLDQLAFNEQGLIPAITQDATSKEILMFAWMNREALEQTLSTNRVTYWSRSRKSLWVKGESSGHTQALVSMHFDCDGDVVLCLANQEGAACHTGRENCFYLKVNNEQKKVFITSDSPEA